MSIMKYTCKYLLYSLLALVVICGVSVLIHHHRTSEDPAAVVSSDTDAPIPIPQLSSKRSASGGHIHADGSFHAESSPPGIGNSNRSVPRQGTPTRRIPRQNAANRSSLGWITWKYGWTSRDVRSYSPYRPDWTPLPEDIMYNSLGLLTNEQHAREVLQKEVLENPEMKSKVKLYDYVDFLGRSKGLSDPVSVLLDKKGNPLPPFTESEFAEEELRRLVGDRDLEAAAQFLEQHGHYNELLVSRLSDERAFDYLYTISGPNGSRVPDGSVRMYAERVVASDPAHLKARLYLADTGSDFASRLDQYESILVDYPGSAHAWIEAGNVLANLRRPFQALAFLQQGHELGARQGHSAAASAYSQIGDYKMAWVSLRKALQVSDKSSHTAFGIAKSLKAIESGVPRVKPLPVHQLDISEKASLPLPFPSDADFAFDVPPSESEVPFLLDKDLSDEDAAFRSAQAEARAAAEAARREDIEMLRQMSLQELDAFIEWADQLMREEVSQVQTTDFLAKEMAAHLTGKPAQFSAKRIVRANELIKRHGYEEGLSRLIKDDPEIAIQIQLFRTPEPKPRIKQ